ALFRDMAERAKATVAPVSSWAGVAAEIERFLAAQALPGPIRVAPDPELNELASALAARLPVGRGPAAPDDATTVTGTFAGIAETGTLMTVSSPAHPTLLNLLAPNHIAVLRADRIVGSYEEAFARLIERLGDKPWPRTVNLITGPSRSADIEQKIQYGAHGPRRLHIVLVGADGGEAGRA
ncbi:MAG: LUD domain-containing protein, partial [Alphaproteobacteria bacterium]